MTATTATSPVSRWLPYGAPEGSPRLYCLPHAGGSASAFRAWAGRVGPVAVCPVQPPGRETRLGEAPHTRMETLVDQLAEVVLGDAGDEPYAVYGHSLGALVGFELLREIRRRGGRDPVRLIVSGSPAPQWDDGVERPSVATMDDARVVEMLRVMGGTPDWLLADPAVLRMILPPFRADFAVRESYRYRPAPPLTVPVTALAATADARVPVGSVADWREQTVHGFTSHTLEGGHFAVFEQPAATQAFLRQALGV